MVKRWLLDNEGAMGRWGRDGLEMMRVRWGDGGVMMRV